MSKLVGGQRHDPVKLFGKRILIVALLAFVVAAGVGVGGVYRKERESRLLRIEAEAQLKDLLERRSQLEADITKLKTSRGVEETLREQYRLAKSGEGLIIIVDTPASAPIKAASSVMEWFNNTFWWFARY